MIELYAVEKRQLSFSGAKSKLRDASIGRAANLRTNLFFAFGYGQIACLSNAINELTSSLPYHVKCHE